MLFSSTWIFWLGAALSLILALLFVMAPFCSKNKHSLRGGLIGVGMGLGLVVGSIALYMHYGALEQVEDKIVIQQITQSLAELYNTDDLSRTQVLNTLTTIEKKLPNRTTPWRYLAGIYQHLGFVEKATQAYQQAEKFNT